jgi:predicted nuclease of predicted toxin-antitoxin system
MARLYADEQYPYPIVEFLRALGHDVVTVQEAGKANQKIPDSDVLAFATLENRAVLTQNRKDFFRLHRTQSDHAGIVACTNDRN